jgi:CheY-like chemotaxis protein
VGGWPRGRSGVTERGQRRRVLVIEDEVIVGMLLEDMLEELGCEVAAISTHIEEALQLARALDIDLAILDINLGGKQSFPVADVLKSRGVPFMFATGYGAHILKPPYSGTPTLQKPFQLDDLQRMLSLSGFQAGGERTA